MPVRSGRSLPTKPPADEASAPVPAAATEPEPAEPTSPARDEPAAPKSLHRSGKIGSIASVFGGTAAPAAAPAAAAAAPASPPTTEAKPAAQRGGRVSSIANKFGDEPAAAAEAPAPVAAVAKPAKAAKKAPVAAAAIPDVPVGEGSNKCLSCGKSVYVTEEIRVDGKLFHRGCFRCTHCNNTLKVGTYASLEGKPYCKPHFKQVRRCTPIAASAPRTHAACLCLCVLVVGSCSS